MFYLNNSSFSYLTCAKRYQFQVVRGLRPPPGGNKYTATGIAGHKMLQLVGDPVPNWSVAIMFGDKEKLHPVIAAVPEAARLKLAMRVDRIFAEHPEMFMPDVMREFKFEDPHGEAIYCGTIDNIMYDVASDTVIITDYKFTSKPIDSYLINSYLLSSQRWFYMLNVKNLRYTLPSAWTEAITSGRLAFRYCFSEVENDNYLLQPAALVDLAQLSYFESLFADKALLAEAIHNDPALAVKEGILTGQCWKCPFTSLCLADDEEAAAQRWPFGSKPYTHNHEEV